MLKCSSSPGLASLVWLWACGSARGQLVHHAPPYTLPHHSQSLSLPTNTTTSTSRPWHVSAFCLHPLPSSGICSGSVSDRSGRPIPERSLSGREFPRWALSGGSLSGAIQSAHSLPDKEEAVPAGVLPGALRGGGKPCAEAICLSIRRY